MPRLWKCPTHWPHTLLPRRARDLSRTSRRGSQSALASKRTAQRRQRYYPCDCTLRGKCLLLGGSHVVELDPRHPSALATQYHVALALFLQHNGLSVRPRVPCRNVHDHHV